MEPRSQNYRQAAADCMRTSARCKGVTAKVFFQDLARRWRDLAQEQEEFENEIKMPRKPAA
jgi:hypothetical protein